MTKNTLQFIVNKVDCTCYLAIYGLHDWYRLPSRAADNYGGANYCMMWGRYGCLSTDNINIMKRMQRITEKLFMNIKIISCFRIKNHDIDWKHGRHLMGLQSSSVIFLIMFKTFAVGWIFFLSGELNAIRAKLNFTIAYMWASPLRSKYSIIIWFPYSL